MGRTSPISPCDQQNDSGQPRCRLKTTLFAPDWRKPIVLYHGNEAQVLTVLGLLTQYGTLRECPARSPSDIETVVVSKQTSFEHFENSHGNDESNQYGEKETDPLDS